MSRKKNRGFIHLYQDFLLQGTKKYNSEELANEFEKYAIDFSSDLFPNYLRLNFLCLNEDFSKAIELMNEVITNSTFDEIEKEKLKLKGEITAELDSPRAKAMDSYCKAMYENHYYGNSMQKYLSLWILLQKMMLLKLINLILHDSKKALAMSERLIKTKFYR